MASLAGSSSGKQEQFSEYKLRVPRNLVKKYNVMKVNTPRPIKLETIKEANMVRKTKKQVYVEEESAAMPTTGAGSVYNFERKEEARRKRRGYIVKEISKEDLPYALRLGGKGGKRFTGRKEPIEHSAYYILTQCPDGVFEAVPIQSWYNFMPDINYSTLSADEVEHEFSKRDRTLSYFTNKYKLNAVTNETDDDEKVRNKDGDHNLMIHDDLHDGNEEDDNSFGSDDEDSKEKKQKNITKKGKSIFHGKKKKSGEDDADSDEEEETENFESKEVDYMSESSSEDELIAMDDEPDPDKEDAAKPKDDLNIFSDSSEENDEENDKLNDAGKELKAILKKEHGAESSEEDDEDIDDEYSKSAIFMQGGKKKKGPDSKQGSRSSTPIQADQNTDSPNKTLKSTESKIGSKRSHERSSPSPQSKKIKVRNLGTKTVIDGKRTDSPGGRSSTPSDSHCITEDAICRYLAHKPMTATDLIKKFKTKKTGLTKEQTVNTIAAILKKIHPNQEKIDGKLFLSLKGKK